MTVIHALAFGDPETESWGVGWLGEPGARARLAFRRGDAADVLEATLARDAPHDAWRLEGEAVSLVLAPSTAPTQGASSGELQTADRICRVSGHATIDAGPADIECFGWHGSAQGLGDLSGIASFRWLAGWLGPSDGFSLLAVRPRKARGHGADLVAATLIEDPSPPRIDDPRLSTTYTEAGLPLRAGLELWPEAPDEDDPEADRTPHYPRRAAGETVGDGLAWEVSGFQVHGSLMRWRSHGRTGPGIYVLAQRT